MSVSIGGGIPGYCPYHAQMYCPCGYPHNLQGAKDLEQQWRQVQQIQNLPQRFSAISAGPDITIGGTPTVAEMSKKSKLLLLNRRRK